MFQYHLIDEPGHRVPFNISKLKSLMVKPTNLRNNSAKIEIKELRLYDTSGTNSIEYKSPKNSSVYLPKVNVNNSSI